MPEEDELLTAEEIEGLKSEAEAQNTPLDLDKIRRHLLFSKDVTTLKDLAENLLEEVARLRGAMTVSEWRYYVCHNEDRPEAGAWGVCYNFMGERTLYASTPHQDHAKKLAMLLNVEAAGKIGVNRDTMRLLADWIKHGSPGLATQVATAAIFTLQYGKVDPDLRALLERLLNVLNHEAFEAYEEEMS